MEEKHALKIETLRSIIRKSGTSEQQEKKNEFKPEILKVSKSLPGVLKVLLASILKIKFDPYNLYKLRIIHFDDSNDKVKFLVDTNSELKLEKAKGKLRDFGNTSFI